MVAIRLKQARSDNCLDEFFYTIKKEPGPARPDSHHSSMRFDWRRALLY